MNLIWSDKKRSTLYNQTQGGRISITLQMHNKRIHNDLIAKPFCHKLNILWWCEAIQYSLTPIPETEDDKLTRIKPYEVNHWCVQPFKERNSFSLRQTQTKSHLYLTVLSYSHFQSWFISFKSSPFVFKAQMLDLRLWMQHIYYVVYLNMRTLGVVYFTAAVAMTIVA